MASILKDFRVFYCSVLKVVLVLVLFQIWHVASYKIGDNPYRRGGVLDTRERYLLEWDVDHRTNRITFNVTVQTRGWILFGLANNAEESTGRDVVIGGLDGITGRAYFGDFHTGRFNEKLRRDISQDYTLQDWVETNTQTFLSFYRDIETCDKQDYGITENKVTIIWAYGDQDSEIGPADAVKRFPGDQGSYDVYLLDPEHSPRIIRQNLYDQVPRVTGSESPTTQVWTMSKRSVMPENHTSYLCSMYKAPRLQKKHHLIGFDVNFANDLSRSHVHHMIVTRCQAPRGTTANSLFERFAQSGQEQICYSLYRPPTGDIPLHLCTQTYMVYALGGRSFFLPDHVGFPFGTDPDEYYVVQVHYNNPEMRSGVTVGIDVNMFYTRRLRENDGGILAVGHDVPGLPESLIIPPKTPNLRLFAHCGSNCMGRILPDKGITVVSALLHAHTSGRQLRLHHFRNNEELPWIIYDDNYSNDYQQVRALPRGEVQFYPGDHVTLDCTFSNTWTNGTVVGGYSTSQEMCLAYLYYYTLIPEYSLCRSGIESPAYRQRFLGVTNVTWIASRLDWVAMPPAPKFLRGQTITDISDHAIDWDDEARRDLQEFLEQHRQTEFCSQDLHSLDASEVERIEQSFPENGGLVFSGTSARSSSSQTGYSGPVRYPQDVIPYAITDPETICTVRGIFPKPNN